jgi:Icc-related predicted phosphoesterase
MKIQIISDIHLEFGVREFELSKSDLLILAGDIHVGEEGLLWISERVKHIPVIYVLGNHEYYKNSYPKLLYDIKKSAQGSNIHILENDSICIGGITFHGSTLWTDFELFGDPGKAQSECEQKMNDYHLIQRDPSYAKLRSIDTYMLHKDSLKWLDKSLTESKSEINVVITHHAPSIKSITEKYRNYLISAAFASNLEKFIQRTKPNIWIHGHLHKSSDYYIDQTRVICNPKGYPSETVNGYQDNLIIEIDS